MLDACYDHFWLLGVDEMSAALSDDVLAVGREGRQLQLQLSPAEHVIGEAFGLRGHAAMMIDRFGMGDLVWLCVEWELRQLLAWLKCSLPAPLHHALPV